MFSGRLIGLRTTDYGLRGIWGDRHAEAAARSLTARRREKKKKNGDGALDDEKREKEKKSGCHALAEWSFLGALTAFEAGRGLAASSAALASFHRRLAAIA